MYASYPFIDASTEGYEEEEVFYEEEEEHFDQYTNQGKLLPMQDTMATLFIWGLYQSQVFSLQALLLFIKAYFYS